MSTLRFRVIGRVQGVSYRAWARQTALELGLRGWVRNLTDGSVEGHAAGPDAALDTFVTALHAGPPHARVSAVETRRTAPPNPDAGGDGFIVRPTSNPTVG